MDGMMDHFIDIARSVIIAALVELAHQILARYGEDEEEEADVFPVEVDIHPPDFLSLTWGRC